MFNGIKNVAAYGKTWFEKAMKEPDVNSRLVFLLHGVASAFGMVAVTIAFIFVTTFTNKSAEHYEHFILALGGSSAGSAVGRYFTKKDGGDPGAPPPPPPPPLPTQSVQPQQPSSTNY